MKRLIAALASVRAKIQLVEALLEEGDETRAIEVLGEAESQWRDAIQELRVS